MRSAIRKRSVTIDGHKTSISLEEPFWNEIKAIASQKKTSIKDLITDIDRGKQAEANLSSSLRVFILRHYRATTERVTPGS
jgi:predicted DNA-binding ribbon-helix-helix protein